MKDKTAITFYHPFIKGKLKSYIDTIVYIQARNIVTILCFHGIYRTVIAIVKIGRQMQNNSLTTIIISCVADPPKIMILAYFTF